jgi:hypothetical protein
MGNHSPSTILYIDNHTLNKANASPPKEWTNINSDICFVSFLRNKFRNCRKVNEFTISDDCNVVSGIYPSKEIRDDGKGGDGKKVANEKHGRESIAYNSDLFLHKAPHSGGRKLSMAVWRRYFVLGGCN